MTPFAIAFFILNSGALLLFPRNWAPLPLIAGACYMTLAQGVEVGPFSFTFIRMLLLAGFIRIIIRGERPAGGMCSLDWLMIAFALLALSSSFFRPDITEALIWRLGLVFNTLGVYFLIRIFCQSLEDVRQLVRITAILLSPVAIAMIYEQLFLHNLFSYLGGVPSTPGFREGGIRSQGPFRHAILAGTVGAVCLPLMAGLWKTHRKAAIVGIVSCVTIVFCSNSSGPLVSALAGIGGLIMWHQRHKMRVVRWVAVIGYIALDLLMKAPAYYLMGRIPLVPGSTGWHRAELINSAIRHLNEWWLWGTDYTRHWMPTGVSWSPDHTDITNHYIKMGVVGGLPLMILFIITLAKGFSYVGKTLQRTQHLAPHSAFLVWSLGASLFANAATMISVSYFDQSFLFLYLTLAAVGSTYCAKLDGLFKDQTGENTLMPSRDG